MSIMNLSADTLISGEENRRQLPAILNVVTMGKYLRAWYVVAMERHALKHRDMTAAVDFQRSSHALEREVSKPFWQMSRATKRRFGL